jgi:hypothetical protein
LARPWSVSCRMTDAEDRPAAGLPSAPTGGAGLSRVGPAVTGRPRAAGAGLELWLAPTGSGTLAVKVAPLLLAVPGLLRHRMRTHRWLSAAGVARTCSRA